MTNGTRSANSIKKLHVEAIVEFAINHIPSVDADTLLKYLELINANGNFGLISQEQLTAKMMLIMKYIPDACEESLRTLGELLEVPFPSAAEQEQPPSKNEKVVGTITPLPERPPMRPAANQ